MLNLQRPVAELEKIIDDLEEKLAQDKENACSHQTLNQSLNELNGI